jgi:hypothetical protein
MDPYGSNHAERKGARDIFVWDVIVGGALIAIGVVSFVALHAVDQIAEVGDDFKAVSAGVGLLGGVVFGLSVILMRFVPPPNPY